MRLTCTSRRKGDVFSSVKWSRGKRRWEGVRLWTASRPFSHSARLPASWEWRVPFPRLASQHTHTPTHLQHRDTHVCTHSNSAHQGACRLYTAFLYSKHGQIHPFICFSVTMCPEEVQLILSQLEKLVANAVTRPQSYRWSVPELRSEQGCSQASHCPIALSKGQVAMPLAAGQSLTAGPARCARAKRNQSHRTNIRQGHSVCDGGEAWPNKATSHSCWRINENKGGYGASHKKTKYPLSQPMGVATACSPMRALDSVYP